MKWIVSEVLGPVARKLGGQGAALLVGMGLAVDHEQAVAAAIAWAILSGVEVLLSIGSRKKLVKQAIGAWGRN